MRALGGAAAILTCISATLGIVMTLRREKKIRQAFAAGEVSNAGHVPEGIGSKVLRVGAILSFIALVLSIAIFFLASVAQNVGSF